MIYTYVSFFLQAKIESGPLFTCRYGDRYFTAARNKLSCSRVRGKRLLLLHELPLLAASGSRADCKICNSSNNHNKNGRRGIVGIDNWKTSNYFSFLLLFHV